MTPHGRARLLIWTRRGVQAAVLVLFLVLVAANRPVSGTRPDGPVGLFFDLDPLVLVGTWLATHTVAGLSVLALITVVVTLLLGRVFCGWFCPFGTLHNAVGSLRRWFRRTGPKTDAFSKWQRAKYYVLIALLVMALGGVHWFGVFDPFSVLYRSTALTIYPALHVGVSESANTVYLDDPHLGPVHLRDATEPVYQWTQQEVFGPELRLFGGITLIFLIFVAALVLNFTRNRFWCRYVCPLGALLGLISRRPLLRLYSESSACNACGICAMRCPAAAQPEKPGEWLVTECYGCWNCVGTCKNQALDFRFAWPWQRTAQGTVDLRKRRLLAAVAGGVGGLMLMRIPPSAHGQTFEPRLIRPPGARPERDFLQRCVQCGMCMEVCPTAALQPAWGEAGLEGLWTPVLVPAIGYCEFNCHACGQVCPTEAIQPLPLPEKQKVKIGLAYIDTTRCLPYAFGRECIVCEEHCPVPDKAIYFEMREVRLRDGTVKTLKHPRIDAQRCTGCGICETKCPFQDRAAVIVTSAGEDRNPANQPFLGGGDEYGDPYGDPAGETHDDQQSDPYGY